MDTHKHKMHRKQPVHDDFDVGFSPNNNNIRKKTMEKGSKTKQITPSIVPSMNLQVSSVFFLL